MLTRKTWIVLASVAATCLMATTVLSQVIPACAAA